MEARNQKAEETHNIVDKRVGINPILMLSSVATAKDEGSMEPELMRISRRELLDIVEKSVPAAQVSEQYAQLIGAGDGKWSYGFRFPEQVEEVALRIPSELRFDCKINNTGSIIPALLAKEMVDKLKFSVEAVSSASAIDVSPGAKREATLATLEPSPEALLAAREIMHEFRAGIPHNIENQEKVGGDGPLITPLQIIPK